MRMRKLRGPTKKTSMPFEPFRTATQPVNVDDLERLFKAGDTVNPETLAGKGLATRKGIPVKVLGRGELSIKLDITAAKFSAEAQRKIEAAGGTCTVIEA
jgi:large subunit ribosomal protein L15